MTTIWHFAAHSMSVRNPLMSLIPLFIHGQHAALVKTNLFKSIANVMNGVGCSGGW